MVINDHIDNILSEINKMEGHFILQTNMSFIWNENVLSRNRSFLMATYF